MEAQKTELWGTFSVKDHLRRRPFIAEVLLYDYLLIPRPPTKEEESPKAGEKDQVNRWREKKWNPSKLRRILGMLEEAELAIALPWNKQARQDWENLYHQEGESALGAKRSEYFRMVNDELQWAKKNSPDQAPFMYTAGVIAFYVKNELKNEVCKKIWVKMPPEAEVEPVIAYRSYQKFKKEQKIGPDEAQSQAEEPTQPYMMLGWDFFVPEDTEADDYTLLEKAIKLAKNPDFRKARQSFQGWVKQLNTPGREVDPETAKAEMLRMLKEYQGYMKAEWNKSALRYAAKFSPLLAPLAGLIPEVGKEGEIAAGVIMGAFGIAVEGKFRAQEPGARLQAAAMVNQARRFFGKKR